jgi:peptide/nickel transport system permease protein
MAVPALLFRRLLSAVPLLFVVSFTVFLLVALAPGDPAARLAGENPTKERVEEVRRALNLDAPLIERYGRWLIGAAKGDFGRSLATTEPVVELMSRRVPITFSLTALALVISVVLGLAGGIIAAVWRNGVADRIVTVLASLGLALPAFWVALILVVPLAIDRNWFPALGYVPISSGVGEWLRSLTLPAVTLALLPSSEMALQVRAALIETLEKDYIVAARARGLSVASITLKHALKNAAIPVVTVLGFRIAQLLGGSVIIESVFALNGLGTLAITAALASDMPVLLGLTMVTTLTVIAVNFLVDASYLYFNPKGRGA